MPLEVLRDYFNQLGKLGVPLAACTLQLVNELNKRRHLRKLFLVPVSLHFLQLLRWQRVQEGGVNQVC